MGSYSIVTRPSEGEWFADGNALEVVIGELDGLDVDG